MTFESDQSKKEEKKEDTNIRRNETTSREVKGIENRNHFLATNTTENVSKQVKNLFESKKDKTVSFNIIKFTMTLDEWGEISNTISCLSRRKQEDNLNSNVIHKTRDLENKVLATNSVEREFVLALHRSVFIRRQN